MASSSCASSASDDEPSESKRRGGCTPTCCVCCIACLFPVIAFCVALKRNYNCNPYALQNVEPPFGGELLPASIVLKERVFNWTMIQLTKVVDVYDGTTGERLGYFYDMNFMWFTRFGYSDASDRIWFEARRPWWSGAKSFSEWVTRQWVFMSEHYYLQRCDNGVLGRLGGIYYVDEDISLRPWWCKEKCMKIIDLARQDDKKKHPPLPMAKVHFNYTLEWFYGGFKTRQAWNMKVNNIFSNATVAEAQQRFDLQNYNFCIGCGQYYLSRWDVHVTTETPELPNWVIAFMAALDDIDEGGETK